MRNAGHYFRTIRPWAELRYSICASRVPSFQTAHNRGLGFIERNGVKPARAMRPRRGKACPIPTKNKSRSDQQIFKRLGRRKQDLSLSSSYCIPASQGRKKSLAPTTKAFCNSITSKTGGCASCREPTFVFLLRATAI